MAWQMQEAKQKLSEVVDRAVEDGPQTITRHGVDVVVVVAIDEYRRLTDSKPSFAEYLLSGPSFDDLDLKRSKDLPRDIEW